MMYVLEEGDKRKERKGERMKGEGDSRKGSVEEKGIS